jgi:flagellar hook-associated protein 1 FlgK
VQVQAEVSVTGFLQARQQALQYAQANLGQRLDRQTSGAEGAAASQGLLGDYGLAEGLSTLFNSFQSLSTNPTSLAERQVLLMRAQTLASQFNQTDQRLADLHDSLDFSMQTDLASANRLLGEIAKLNNEIADLENRTRGIANDLRDQRQAKIEELSRLINIETSQGTRGNIDIAISGVSIVSGNQVLDTLETYDAGGGQLLVRTQTGGTPLPLTGGRIQGTIEARDGALATLRGQLNTLASSLITEVNAVHTGGFSLTGSTGEAFFSGTDAATIAVNQTLLDNPALIQASGTAGAVGDNQTALALGQLANKKLPGFNNQTFSESYAQTVAELGEALNSVDGQLSTQEVVESMLRRQRDAVSGVSLDEEMTDLLKFQKAYQASARLITTIDEMLSTVLNMKR